MKKRIIFEIEEVSQNFSKFTENTCTKFLFNKVAGLKAWSFIKK